MLGDLTEDSTEAQRAKVRDEQEHPDEEAEVAYTVDHESFSAGVGCGVTREIEADEQIRREAHSFPSDEHQQEVLRKNKSQHEKHEEVQVGEESPVTPLHAPCIRRSRDE